MVGFQMVVSSVLHPLQKTAEVWILVDFVAIGVFLHRLSFLYWVLA
jgi:hypothetical protein